MAMCLRGEIFIKTLTVKHRCAGLRWSVSLTVSPDTARNAYMYTNWHLPIQTFVDPDAFIKIVTRHSFPFMWLTSFSNLRQEIRPFQFPVYYPHLYASMRRITSEHVWSRCLVLLCGDILNTKGLDSSSIVGKLRFTMMLQIHLHHISIKVTSSTHFFIAIQSS